MGSSPADGSSSTRISGPSASARATAARFFMPPESSWGSSFPKSARPTAASFIQTIRSTTEGASCVCSRSGKAMLSSTASELNKAALWKATPIERRTFFNSDLEQRVISIPFTWTLPDFGRSSPMI